MKITPEQKAFFEYGAAWGTTVVIHTFIRSLLKDKGYQLSPELLHHYRDEKSHYGAVLREAWKWRRNCRAWVPLEKRECRTCSYLEEDNGSEICENCMIINSLASSCNWEPRKEGE